MTKLRKKLLHAVVFALCVTVFACLFAACDNTPKPEDNAVTYTVTVQKDATTPAKDVSVQIRKGGAGFERKNTDANGKAEFELAPDSYEVVLTKLPANYSVPEGATLTLTADSRDLTVTLEKSFTYTVKLVTPDGKPFYAEGVLVGICTLDGNCLSPVPIDENGVAEIPAEPGNYHVQLPELPAGYAFECDEQGYYTGKNFSATDTEMTITIYSAESVTSVTPMTDAEKKTSSESIPSYNESAQQYVSYKHVVELKTNEIAYFCVVPEISGRYNFYSKGQVLFLSDGTQFVVGNTGNYMPPTLICEAGKPYYFKAINNEAGAATAEFIVTAPFSSYTLQNGKGGVLEVTVGKENTNAVIAFGPTEAGPYKVTAQGDARAVISTSPSTFSEFIETPPADSEYSANATASFMAYTSEVQGKSQIYISFTAKAESYPVTLNVKIERTDAPVMDSYRTVEVSERLTQFEKPADQELSGVPLDGTAKLVYNETDRFYHLDTQNGPVVVVNITGALEANRFEAGCTLAYMELVNEQLAVYKFVTKTDVGEDTEDYSVFLRGFSQYEYTNGAHGFVPSIPSQITTETYYAKYVNEDGVYPLTEELKDFLEKFYRVNKFAFDWNLPVSVNAESAWMFPCYYYVQATDADPITGTYKFVSLTEEGTTYRVDDAYAGYNPAVADGLTEGKLTAESSIIRIDKNGNFSVLPYNTTDGVYGDPYDFGTWTKEGDVYQFVCNYGTLTYANGTFTYDDGAGCIIIYSK